MGKIYGHYEGIAWEEMRRHRRQCRKVDALKALTVNLEGIILESCVPGSGRPWAQSLITLSGIEMSHYGLGHKVVCVDTESALDMAQQKNDVRIHDLQFPAPIFEICFEQGTRLPTGEPLPSMLISLPAKERTREYARLLGNAFAANALVAVRTMGKDFAKVIADATKKLLAVADGSIQSEDCGYTDELNNAVFIMYGIVGTDGERNLGFMELPSRRDAPIEELIAGLNSVSDAGGKPFDAATESMRNTLARIALNFIIYLNAGGMLEATKLFNRPKMANVAPLVQQLPIGVRWHWRRSHYRTLRDQRYYRTGPYPPEHFRIIRVKNSVVKRGEEPAEPGRNQIWPLEKV